MKYRIAIWAAAGFIVASGWALYFLVASKNRPIDPIAPLLCACLSLLRWSAGITPLASILTLVTNVATYALVDLGVEILLRHSGTQTSS